MNNSSEETAELIASKVIDQFGESFAHLTLDSDDLHTRLDEFEEQKLEDVESKNNYETKIEYIRQYFNEETDVNKTDELTGADIKGYYDWRKYESLDRDEPLKKSTLSDDMYLFREFVEELADNQYVPLRFKNHVEIPNINPRDGEGVDEKKVDPELAAAALDYLRTYHYASVEHVAVEIMCASGPRQSDLRALDVEDHTTTSENILSFLHRDETALKKDSASNRKNKYWSDVQRIIDDYLTNKRPETTDENGRRPLLTKGDGRIAESTLRKTAYKWTRPCAVGLDCPHDRDVESCDAAQSNNDAFRCPSSRATHHFRKGFITDQRNKGVSPEAIEHRCDVSPATQRIHYDLPDEDQERKRYESEFESANQPEESGSGFNP